MRRAAVLFALVAPLALGGCLNQFEDPHHVRIVNVDLQPDTVLSQDVLLNVTATLDNRGGGASGGIRLGVKAYSEESGFLVAENETQVGVIAGDTTRPVSLGLKVPRLGNVRVDVTVFEDEQGKERASISARNLGALEPGVLDTGLRVRDMDFLVQNVTSEGNRTQARIQTDLYVTNEGRDASENLRVQVKAREVSTRLVADVAWIETSSVPTGSTIIRSTNLTVADGYNYAIEVLTWRGDGRSASCGDAAADGCGGIVVARNEGIVQLAPTFTRSKDMEVITTNPNVNDFLSSPTAQRTDGASYGGNPSDGLSAPSPRVPGFGAGAALVAALVVGLLFAKRRRRSL